MIDYMMMIDDDDLLALFFFTKSINNQIDTSYIAKNVGAWA